MYDPKLEKKKKNKERKKNREKEKEKKKIYVSDQKESLGSAMDVFKCSMFGVCGYLKVFKIVIFDLCSNV